MAIGNVPGDAGVRSQSNKMLVVHLHGLIVDDYEVCMSATPSRLLIIRARSPARQTVDIPTGYIMAAFYEPDT